MRRTLRLHPLGYPRTHKLKMRMTVQAHLVTVAASWGYVVFEPCNIVNGMRHSGAAAAGNAATPADTSAWGSVNHLKLAWYNKDHTGTTAITKQPYGLDQWLDSAPYSKIQVLGAKITVIIAKGAFADSGDNFIGGFTSLHAESDHHNMRTFKDAYDLIGSGEVSDLLNSKLLKNPKIFSDTGKSSGLGQSWSTTFSQMKWIRAMRRHGTDDSYDFEETAAAAQPVENPVVMFIVADLAGSTAAKKISFIINIDYTAKLTGYTSFQTSAV